MPKRRRGSRAAHPLSSAPSRVLPAGSRAPSFEVLVDRALAGIPEAGREALMATLTAMKGNLADACAQPLDDSEDREATHA